MRLPLPLALAATAAVTLAGCGTRSETPGGAQPIATPTPLASIPQTNGLGSASNAAGWSAVVTSEPGGQLQLAVTVSGPLTVVGGCEPTLTAWAVTPDGSPVPTSTPEPAAHCMAIAIETIPTGTTHTFTATLPEPPPPGTYVIEGSVRTEGSPGAGVPPVTITIYN